MLISDTCAHRIIRCNVDTGEVQMIVGGGQGYVDGSVLSARFSYPTGIDAGPDGEIYVCDGGNNAVRMILDGEVTTIAGGGKKGMADGVGIEAEFLTLFGIAATHTGDVFVTDPAANSIRRIKAVPKDNSMWRNRQDPYDRFPNSEFLYETETVTKEHNPGYYDSSLIKDARINTPVGIAMDMEKNIYFADSDNDAIRHIHGFVLVSTFAGAPPTIATSVQVAEAAADNNNNNNNT
mmetsp:Transcript_15111/g.24108  ORF Transcript_15111/g.24108 Transcript_15111/m.24108 type:complete len:236 (-) Transcript_15111:15-722(-)